MIKIKNNNKLNKEEAHLLTNTSLNKNNIENNNINSKLYTYKPVGLVIKQLDDLLNEDKYFFFNLFIIS